MKSFRGNEHPDHPGFYVIPQDPTLLINCDGTVIRLPKGNIVKPDNHRGYKVIRTRINGKRKKLRIHRLLAEFFLYKPDDTDAEYQVNHKDGDKANNSLSNLEWVTPRENVLHAYYTDLTKHGRRVLSKDLDDGRIESHIGLQSCARAFNLSLTKLKDHLDSEFAGRIRFKNVLFKDDDGKAWPDHVFVCREVDHYFDDIVAISTDGVKSFTFSNDWSAAEYLGLDANLLAAHLVAYGDKKPFEGYIFKKLTNIDRFSETVTVPRNRLSVINKHTGISEFFQSASDFAKKLKVDPSWMLKRIRRDGEYGDYLVEIVERV